ncbi:hypothetical protein [Gelidibacter pelagius]|uniref:Uncharacterized protein n=1 Tax=Gelidibacter pelagius TaxID=2819985 RepID=A0ABS3SWF9_9FLAO|nr:hypothetical protein [Gelidibacter pelagius]MBO3100032.1 hypothetical protein [Gelidibacter pelagius]
MPWYAQDKNSFDILVMTSTDTHWELTKIVNFRKLSCKTVLDRPKSRFIHINYGYDNYGK